MPDAVARPLPSAALPEPSVRLAGEDPLAALRRQLAAGAFADGRLPPERSLAGALGVGRRALREALDILEAEGRIWRRQGQGTFVGPRPAAVAHAPRDTQDLSQRISPVAIMEARLTVEPALSRLAAMRASAAEIEALSAAAGATASAQTAADYETHDRAFHRKIAEIADNDLFLAMFDLISAVRQRADWAQMRAKSFSPGRVQRLSGEHAAILGAITERNPQAAEEAMRQHLREVAFDLVGMDPLPVLGRPAPER